MNPLPAETIPVTGDLARQLDCVIGLVETAREAQRLINEIAVRIGEELGPQIFQASGFVITLRRGRGAKQWIFDVRETVSVSSASSSA